MSNIKTFFHDLKAQITDFLCSSFKEKTGHRQFIYLFIVSFAFHLLYILFTGLDLAPDEPSCPVSANFGNSKGPLGAYVIAFFTFIFGDNPFGVRFGATLFSQIMLVVGYYLTWKMFENKMIAFITSLMMLIVPLFATGAVLMTTDPIYVMFWSLCVWASFKVIKNSNPKYFYLVSIFAGLGFLAKYNMALIYLCLLLFFLTSKKRRELLNKSHFYISLVLTFIMCLPIIIWTIKHDFVNFLHVFYQGKNQSTASMISFKLFFEFIGGQLGVVSPLLLGLMIWASFKTFFVPRDHKWKVYFELLNCFGLPVFIIYFILSFKIRIYPNWPAPSYFSLLLLTAGMSLYAYENFKLTAKRRFKKIIYGIRYFGSKIFPETVSFDSPYLTKLATKGLRLVHDPRKDPTNRLKGWKELGLRVDEIMSTLDKENFFIFSSQYQIAGEIAFYTKEKYQTYCINFGRRLNQYDLWGGWNLLLGKNALQVQDTKTEIHRKVLESFQSCEKLEYFEAKRLNKVIKTWTIFKCYNFKGLEEEDSIMSY